MRCSKCGFENPEWMKFCGQCTNALALVCPKCRCENPPGFKFCGQCSAALAPPEKQNRVDESAPSTAIPDGERKTVTALFADIKDSTEMMRDLDPEEARAIVDPALKLMVDAVRRYDGYVVQPTGDGIFALFGAPTAYEDHAQRALYAALRMQEALREHAERLAAQGKPAPQARVGVNTGEVVMRMVETGGRVEYTPVGHVANLAARLQGVAPAGGIVISEETRHLVEGYFELRGLGKTEVKGVSEPVSICEVVGIGALRGHFELAARRGLTKFVGREREVAELKRALELARSGHGQIVAAVAEAGIGKSRLVYEFKAMLPGDCKVLEAYSVSHGKASAYLPVLELLYGYFGIEDADDKAARRSKIDTRLGALDPALNDTLPLLYTLMRLHEGPDPLAQMDPQIKRRRTLEAIKRIILRESLNQPTVVIFEDLHWIDGETQALLDLLADGIANSRTLLLVNYRPEYRHEWGNKSYYTQLRLDPLGRESAAEMLSTLLGDGVELNPLKRLIVERTEGNPFFIEEMVQALFDEGALVRNGSVKVARSLSQLRLPPTVQGILASRIDRLSREHKELIQTLAVMGRESPLALIKQVASPVDGELERGLSVLQASEFIYEQPAATEVEYVFKHALTQEVAYNSLLLERRKLLHERAGAAIEALYAERLDDHLSELAGHYQRSANTIKALEYLGRAGQRAAQRSSHAEAVGLFTTALELLQTMPETPERLERELVLQLGLGSALMTAMGWSVLKVGQAFERARELCRQIGETPHLFQALAGLFVYYDVRGEMEPTLELAKQLLSIAQSADDAAFLPAAHHAMAEPLYLMGQFIPARTHVERSLSLYDPARYPSHAVPYFGVDVAVHSLTVLATSSWALGFPDKAIESDERAVALARELARPFSLCFALGLSVFVYSLRGEAQAISKVFDELFHLATEQGFRQMLALGILLRGIELVVSGRAEEGVAVLREVFDSVQAGDGFNLSTWFLAFLAEAHVMLGRVDEGFAVLAEAMALVESTGVRIIEAELYRLKGELTLKRPAAGANSKIKQEAESYFRNAIEIARRQSAKSWELRATTSLASLLAKQDRRDEARTMLAEIYNWFTEGFDTRDLKDAKVLLDELSNY